MPVSRIAALRNQKENLPETPTSPAASFKISRKKEGLPQQHIELLPRGTINIILDLLCPEVFKVRRLSQSWKQLVEKYIDKRTKRWKGMCDEADAWGSRPPALSDLIRNDPLLSAFVLKNVYEAKLRLQLVNTSAPNACSKVGAFQRTILKLFETSVEEYEELSFSIPVLLSCIRRNRIQFQIIPSENSPDECVKSELKKKDRDMLLDDGSDSENEAYQMPDVSENFDRSFDIISVKMKDFWTAKKDPQFTECCRKLLVKACMAGAKWDVPAILDLEQSIQIETLCSAVSSAIRKGNSVGVEVCLHAARVADILWIVLDCAMQTGLQLSSLLNSGNWSTSEVTNIKNSIWNVLSLVFHDPEGPAKVAAMQRLERMKTLECLEELQYDNKSAAKQLLLKADELVCTLKMTI
ncbi:hypothetical protein HK096_002153 [Nowakowskiella sp. JEL0078]|nr:hypothetical protein HK096_002153 [Nowakowskiella sp. JEL0078]